MAGEKGRRGRTVIEKMPSRRHAAAKSIATAERRLAAERTKVALAMVKQKSKRSRNSASCGARGSPQIAAFWPSSRS